MLVLQSCQIIMFNDRKEAAMPYVPNIFPLLCGLFLLICAVLYFIPSLKILNFVDYGTADDGVALNRYAALRLLLPAAVCAACAVLAAAHPRLTLPLVFPMMISVLASVIWINAGLRKVKRSD